MKKLNKVIGIISYLPDDEDIRKRRKNKLLNLIFKCNYLFSLPIYIIAQNYRDEDIINFKNCNIIRYKDKLGITGAREELRNEIINKSISNNIDYLIMLDDDITITGSDGKKYLSQIDENPGCFIENNKTRLQLFAISIDLLKLEGFDNINPENEEGFEDRIFVNKLRLKYPDKRRIFEHTGIEEEAIATNDPDSTWYKNQDIDKMLENTENIIRNYKKA